MPPVELWRASVDRNGVALGRVANGLGALVQQITQHHTAVVLGSPDQKVLRARSPSALKPVCIALKPTRSRDHGFGLHPLLRAAFIGKNHLSHPLALHIDVGHFRVIAHLNPQRFGPAIERVHQRFSPTQKERIGAG